MRVPHTVINTFKARIIAATGLVILVVTISLLSRGHTTAQAPRDCPGVSICNTVSQPVPVSQQGVARVEGSVNIGNAESQPVPVSPQGITRVEGAVDVRSPVNVQTSPRAPLYFSPALVSENIFVRQITITLPMGDPFAQVYSSEFQVPAGKLLKVDFVSADIEMGHANQVPQVQLSTWNGIPQVNLGGYVPHHLTEVLQNSKGSATWSISQPLSVTAVSPNSERPLEIGRASCRERV